MNENLKLYGLSNDYCEIDEKNDESFQEYDEGNEWDQIKALPLIDLSNDQSISNSLRLFPPDNTLCVTLDHVRDYFHTTEISSQLSQIHPVTVRKGICGFLSRMFCLNPKSLSGELTNERDRIFALALHSFDNRDTTQTRMLTTIYQKLTDMADCKRYGSHWERIGFQGADPATDLRGVGLLSLIQILFFILSSETSQLAKDIYRLSTDSQQNFPFVVMSTNITQISLQILREGLLNQECNQAKSVLKVFNWFYAGVYFQLFKIWEKEKKTIVDAGYVLRDLKSYARKNVKKIIVDMLNYQIEKRIKNTNDAEVEFSNLGHMFGDLEEVQSQNQRLNSQI